MPEKDEPICVHRTRHGIVAYKSLAALARDWTLAPTPTQFIPFGYLHSSRPKSSAPHPHPQITSKGHWLYAVSYESGGRREPMNF
jgi:hypothetical protein